MKKKMIITVSVVMVALLGLAAAGAANWHGARSAEHRIDYIKYKITESLDLTEAQAATLDRITADLLAEHDQMESRRNEFKTRLFDVLNQDQVTAEDLSQLFEEKKPHIEHLMQVAAQNIAEFHAILTPEQRSKLITEMKNHRRGCRFGK